MKMDLVPYNNENLLTDFPPILKKNFELLFSNGDIGLPFVSLNDISANKQYTKEDIRYTYSYNVRIPYAGKHLVWEIIFDPEDPGFAPDLNFNDDNFTLVNDIDKIFENIPSLINWNVNNPKSLGTLLTEFLNLYKKQQIQKLQQDNIYAQLNSEFQLLTEEVALNDIEIYLESTCAHFLVNIKVDTSILPEYLQQQNNIVLNPGSNTCLLKVTYLKLDGTKVKTSLQLSPHLDQVLGNAKDFAMANYTKAPSLLEYHKLISKLLEDCIKNVEQHYKLRKEFMTCLCTVFAGKIVEFDTEKFSRAELLHEVDNFECLVQIELGECFPDEQPAVTLFSVYCVPLKKVCFEQIKDYLYSPRWSPENILKKLMGSLNLSIQKFRNHKH